MPSRKGKGRQSLGFGRKSQRAQFHSEWQARLDEDYYAQRRKEQKQLRRKQQDSQWIQGKIAAAKSNKSNNSNNNNNKEGLQKSLRRMIAERQYWDRLEDRSWILAGIGSGTTGSAATKMRSNNSNSSNKDVSPPGWLVYHQDKSQEAEEVLETFAPEFRYPLNNDPDNSCNSSSSNNNNPQDLDQPRKPSGNRRIPTLQALSLHALAQALPEYLQALGVEQLQHYLSLLSGPALSVLSTKLSQFGHMTNDLCRAVCQQTHVTRLSIMADPHDSRHETDEAYKSLRSNTVLELLLPKVTTPPQLLQPLLLRQQQNQQQQEVEVPDSWEDWLSSDDEDQHCTKTTNHSYYDNSNHHHNHHPYHQISIPTTTTTTFWKGCCQLERLELGRMPYLDVALLQQVLLLCASTLTHLGLSGSLTYDRGPDVLWHLSEWVPLLQVLDVSGNTTWISEPLLRSVYESYKALEEDDSSNSNYGSNSSKAITTMLKEDDDNILPLATTTTTAAVVRRPRPTKRKQQQQQQQQSTILIKATGCLTRSSQIIMEMEFGTIF